MQFVFDFQDDRRDATVPEDKTPGNTSPTCKYIDRHMIFGKIK